MALIGQTSITAIEASKASDCKSGFMIKLLSNISSLPSVVDRKLLYKQPGFAAARRCCIVEVLAQIWISNMEPL